MNKRQIEFRIPIYSHTTGAFVQFVYWSADGGGCQTKHWTVTPNDWIWGGDEQYIGVNDRNCTKLYENDIVQNTVGDFSITGTIIFEEGCFKIKNYSSNITYELSDSKYIEKIGSSHEITYRGNYSAKDAYNKTVKDLNSNEGEELLVQRLKDNLRFNWSTNERKLVLEYGNEYITSIEFEQFEKIKG